MKQNQRAARPLQLHPAKAAIVILFNLYLGRNSRQKSEDPSKETTHPHIAARLIPVIPLIIYRLIENDATDIAERVLALYSSVLILHPFGFTIVRDILAYFCGHLPSKLIVRILKVLDISKIAFSESFPQHLVHLILQYALHQTTLPPFYSFIGPCE